MHSVAMGTMSNLQASRMRAVEPAVLTGPAATFVRLAELRKLRRCEQVAAVCYRVCRGEVKFLLVRTRGSGRWTFPKGSAEPGLTHAQAAALEAFEEAGVHGRIEEASFARYERRGRTAVSAYLCEVLWLGNPKEAKRNRTWFSVEDARQRLREGRTGREGTEFARVVDRAVARIQQTQCESSPDDDGLREERLLQVQPRWHVPQSDPLQKVKFDFADAYNEGSHTPEVRRSVSETRQSPPAVARSRVLQCEVLEFGAPREPNLGRGWFPARKKPKALGTGARNG